jgi:hypothetical protein
MISLEELDKFVEGYCDNVRRNLELRWSAYTPKVRHSYGSDAIAGLLARQATLSIELARNPGIWNGNVAALLLRSMTDTHITLAWILESPNDRGREYILYGLGQEKLQIEQLKAEGSEVPEEEKNSAVAELIDMREEWLHSQIAHWAIDVNLGSWSGKSTRQMAAECGCDSLYKFAYTPFSGATHSMWNHVGIYNVERCQIALHNNHYLPIIRELNPDPDFLYRSAKYVSRSFRTFSEKVSANADITLPVEFFLRNFPNNREGDEG